MGEANEAGKAETAGGAPGRPEGTPAAMPDAVSVEPAVDALAGTLPADPTPRAVSEVPAAPAPPPVAATPTRRPLARRALLALGQLLMLLALAVTLLGAMPGGIAGALAAWRFAAVPFGLGAFLALAAARPALRPIGAGRRTLAQAAIAVMLASGAMSLVLAGGGVPLPLGGGGPPALFVPGDFAGPVALLQPAIAALFALGLLVWWMASRKAPVLREPMRPLRMTVASFGAMALALAAAVMATLPVAGKAVRLPAGLLPMALGAYAGAALAALIVLLLALTAGRRTLLPAGEAMASVDGPPARRLVGVFLYAVGGLFILTAVAGVLGAVGAAVLTVAAGTLPEAVTALPKAAELIGYLKTAMLAGPAAAAVLLLASWFTFWLAATR
ncbi:MAG: hypothetical protein U1E56_01325 [Bauldia sp.]